MDQREGEGKPKDQALANLPFYVHIPYLVREKFYIQICFNTKIYFKSSYILKNVLALSKNIEITWKLLKLELG